MHLLCVGDIAFPDRCISINTWPPFEGFIPGNNARILFNWELPVGEKLNPLPRTSGPRLLSHPGSVDIIGQWAPGFASLATNHILDAGEEGLSNTIFSLRQKGFITCGAGMSQEEITRPLIWETAEGKLAIINWVFPETHPDWMYIPGPNCWPGIEDAKGLIRKLRQEADWILVFAHWSDELFPYPRPEDRMIAQQLANAGIDMLISHHPHVVRGMEIIGGCPVFYSLGNFFFSDFQDASGKWIVKQSPRNREALCIQISFTRGLTPEYKTLSLRQIKDRIVFDPHKLANRRMSRASRPLERFIGKEYEGWYKSKRLTFDKILVRWHFGIRRLGFYGFFYTRLTR